MTNKNDHASDDQPVAAFLHAAWQQQREGHKPVQQNVSEKENFPGRRLHAPDVIDRFLRQICVVDQQVLAKPDVGPER